MHSCGSNKLYKRSNTQIDSTYLGSGLGQMYNGAYIAEYKGGDTKETWKKADDWNHLFLLCTKSDVIAQLGTQKMTIGGKQVTLTRGQEQLKK